VSYKLNGNRVFKETQWTSYENVYIVIIYFNKFQRVLGLRPQTCYVLKGSVKSELFKAYLKSQRSAIMFSHLVHRVTHHCHIQNIGKLKKKNQRFHIVDSKGSDDGVQHSGITSFFNFIHRQGF
jgi:hypothetical protein